jgi:hypothetical protein
LLISRAGLGTSSAATQVCSTNSAPTSARPASMARPIRRALPRFSSASVAIPSKPRNESTAMDTAVNTTPTEKVSGS